MMRDPFDFIINWKTVGNYWPIRDVLQNSVVDILERHHGESPERMEEELWIKLIGDGQCFLQLLNLPCAYCYLCFILSEKAQSSKRLENHGFRIECSIEGMWNDVEILLTLYFYSH